MTTDFRRLATAIEHDHPDLALHARRVLTAMDTLAAAHELSVRTETAALERALGALVIGMVALAREMPTASDLAERFPPRTPSAPGMPREDT